MATIPALEDIFEDLRESQRKEFKASMPWDLLKPKLLRSAIALANARGGFLVVGVEEIGGGSWDRAGMNSTHLATINLDTIRETIEAYCTPCPEIDLALVADNGATYFVMSVDHFQTAPVFANKTCHPEGGVSEGVVYYRFPKPESKRITPARWLEMMQEFVEQKAESRIAAKIQEGWTILPPGSPPAASVSQNDEDLFRKQGEGF